MSPRFPVPVVVAAALAIPAVSSAFAQTPRSWPSPSTTPQSGRGGSTFSLDTLFGALKIAPDDASAKAIVTIEPDYVEAWNRRATLYYLKHEYSRAIADIREVLAREPRHFGALAGLGLILQDIGDDKHALEAYQAALAIDPHLRDLTDTVKTLREKIEGRDI